jgi:hypothetical protein
MNHHRLAWAMCAAAAALTWGCKKKEPEVKPEAKPAAAAAQGAKAADAPGEASPAAAPMAATPVEAEPDPAKNAWNLPARGAQLKDGDRVFVLTQGKDRSYGDASKPYRLFAHDVGEVKGDVITIKELAGGSFKTTGLFVIAAGSQAGEVKVGDLVLAEWASELKHALVQKVEGDKITVRYTDLPDNWAENQLVKVLGPRDVTRQKEGLQPGNFAFAKGVQSRDELVLLIAESGDNWLVRQFSQRVRSVAKSDLRPVPLKPALKAGQAVEVPWVGQIYPAKVTKVLGTRVEVKAEGAQTKEPFTVALGQVAPLEAKPAPAKGN